MTLIELAGTSASLRLLFHPEPDLPAHFLFLVSGRTKGHQESGAKFALPCVGVTQSGLKPGRWVYRYCMDMDKCGFRTGRLFTMGRAGRLQKKQPRLADFEDAFYSTLEAIQAQHNSLIPPDVVVREVYGILRSLRRGVTAHATNERIDGDLLAAINRWHSELRAHNKGRVAALSMPEMYAQLDHIKKFLLGFSGAT